MNRERRRNLCLAAGVAAATAGIGAAVGRGWLLSGGLGGTPAWGVLAGAGLTTATALLAAARLGLPARARRLFPEPMNPDTLITELTDLAALAQGEGLLAAVADPRARGRALLMAGLHLMARDTDTKLLRSVLESQAEAAATVAARRRMWWVGACRAFGAAGVLGIGTALAVGLSHAVQPAAVGSGGAASLLGGVVMFSLTVAVAGPIAARARRMAAAEEFAAMVTIETVMAIHERADRAAAAARLSRLTPGGDRQSQARPALRAA